MTHWPPLTFEPVFRQYIWGGRRLETVLHKPLGDGDRYAESWEVVDHGEDQSVVASGPQQGATLRQLVRQHGDQLLGQHAALSAFPLLFKFLDANQVLSLQVHPNDQQAARLDPPDRGKTEAWVIVDAAPEAVIYAGLKRGFDRAAVERELHRGTFELCMHRFTPQAGDCVFIPAGVPHALGAGLLVAEIQQSSDTTFRLHDWNRVGADGRPRELHIEQGLDVIDYQRGPVEPQTPRPGGRPGVERLVDCQQFVVDRWSGSPPGQRCGGDDRFHILASLQGQGEVRWPGGAMRLAGGQTMLLAAVTEVEIVPGPDLVLLDMYLPDVEQAGGA
jgi:mannose-6-phosphate isomerase